MISKPNPENELEQMIAQYLRGIHHPDEDPLENQLRAEKNTRDLKAAIQKHTDQAFNKGLEAALSSLPEAAVIIANTTRENGRKKC